MKNFWRKLKLWQKILLTTIFVLIIFLATSFFCLYKYLLYKDRQIIRELAPMISYLKECYTSYGQYPTKDEFYKKFHYLGDRLDYDYYYWNGSEIEMGSDYFILQYPMNAKRDFAVGTRKISEFTGTTYAYAITSCNLRGKCRYGDSNEIITQTSFNVLNNISTDEQKIKTIFETYLSAEENCNINLANSIITEKSKEIMHYTCSNMAEERKCHINKAYKVLIRGDAAIIYFNDFSRKANWPFFFSKENSEWKIDFYKMAYGIAMGGNGCDADWDWRDQEIKEEFCGYFQKGECPDN